MDQVMENINRLAHEYTYPRSKRLAAERDSHWFARRVCWYRPTADVMPLWRQDVLAICDAMEGHADVAAVREALATMTDEQLLDLLNNDPTLAPMPDGTYERDTHGE